MSIPYYYCAIPPFYTDICMNVYRYNGIASDMNELKEKIYNHYYKSYIERFYYIGMSEDTTYKQVIECCKDDDKYYNEDEFLRYYALIDGEWKESPVGKVEDFHNMVMKRKYNIYNKLPQSCDTNQR